MGTDVMLMSELLGYCKKLVNPNKTRTCPKTGSKKIRKRHFIWVTCPLCEKSRWISDYALKICKTTLCKKHNWVSKTRWTTERKTCPNLIVDYNKQAVQSISKTRHKHLIWGTCPSCGIGHWMDSHGLKYGRKGSWCKICNVKQAGKTRSSLKQVVGKRVKYGKYVFIHREVLRQELSKKDFAEVTKNVRPAGSGVYYAEHRVVAFLKFGKEAVIPGMVVRHIDGNRENNNPSNLLYGTSRENTQDHMTDRRDLQKWRSLCGTLIKIIIGLRMVS